MSGTIRWIVEFPEGVSKNELEFEQKLTYPIKVKRKKKCYRILIKFLKWVLMHTKALEGNYQ